VHFVEETDRYDRCNFRGYLFIFTHLDVVFEHLGHPKPRILACSFVEQYLEEEVNHRCGIEQAPCNINLNEPFLQAKDVLLGVPENILEQLKRLVKVFER